MGFKAEAFRQSKLEPRTQQVRVSELADWFDGEPVWTVRMVSANELARADAAKQRHQRESELAAALVSGAKGEVMRELARALGRSDDVEPDTARRLELLAAGSVDPVCDLETAVKLADLYPVVFYQLTNAILMLTGQGADAQKKPTASGETPASEAPSPSPTETADSSLS